MTRSVNNRHSVPIADFLPEKSSIKKSEGSCTAASFTPHPKPGSPEAMTKPNPTKPMINVACKSRVDGKHAMHFILSKERRQIHVSCVLTLKEKHVNILILSNLYNQEVFRMRTRLISSFLAGALILGVSFLPMSGVTAVGSEKNIVETAIGAGNFNTLVKAVKAADLVETLSGPGPFTVFAPTDEAFGNLPAGTVEALLKDKAKLTSVLTYHVVSGKHMAADVVKMNSLKSVQGQDITISLKDGAAMADNAKIIKTDIICSNGVIHVIDAVILPK